LHELPGLVVDAAAARRRRQTPRHRHRERETAWSFVDATWACLHYHVTPWRCNPRRVAARASSARQTNGRNHLIAPSVDVAALSVWHRGETPTFVCRSRVRWPGRLHRHTRRAVAAARSLIQLVRRRPQTNSAEVGKATHSCEQRASLCLHETSLPNNAVSSSSVVVIIVDNERTLSVTSLCVAAQGLRPLVLCLPSSLWWNPTSPHARVWSTRVCAPFGTPVPSVKRRARDAYVSAVTQHWWQWCMLNCGRRRRRADELLCHLRAEHTGCCGLEVFGSTKT
jgi:hypothetical protein